MIFNILQGPHIDLLAHTECVCVATRTKNGWLVLGSGSIGTVLRG
jgi:hypothetical protein